MAKKEVSDDKTGQSQREDEEDEGEETGEEEQEYDEEEQEEVNISFFPLTLNAPIVINVNILFVISTHSQLEKS